MNFKEALIKGNGIKTIKIVGNQVIGIPSRLVNMEQDNRFM